MIIYFQREIQRNVKMLGLRNGWKKILAAVVRGGRVKKYMMVPMCQRSRKNQHNRMKMSGYT